MGMVFENWLQAKKILEITGFWILCSFYQCWCVFLTVSRHKTMTSSGAFVQPSFWEAFILLCFHAVFNSEIMKLH